MSPLWPLLKRIIKTGNLRFIDASGHSHVLGDGAGPEVVARLYSRRVEWLLAFDPGLRFGEAYMDGELELERGNIFDFLSILVTNAYAAPLPGWVQSFDRFRYWTRRLRQFNPIGRAQRNISHHYDISDDIYALFLDPDWQYSCAYFPHDGVSLEDAQQAKKRHIAAKLRLADGQRILDVGSGWGGLGLYLAKTRDVHVTGVTLSSEQHKRSRQRARQAGLDRRVDFRLRDYRTLNQRFDRIVSVGMFEHVGVGHYRQFFGKLAELLDDDGIALLHSIGRSEGPGITNPFIAKYIFPGGYIPSLSEVIPAIEQAGLLITDIEILRRHYAETLRHWRERFVASWDQARKIKDERFCRMWEFYLAGSETAFRFQNMMVFQMQLAKKIDALPVTRDYMLEDERRLAAQDAGMGSQPRLAGE